MIRYILWGVGLPFRLIRRFATLVAVLALITSLAFNVATLTISGVYAAASGALSAVGVTTVAAREAGERLARRKASREIARKTAQSVRNRAQRSAARNIASVGGEAIPIVGIAVIAGALAMEVKESCDMAADMAGLEAALDAEEATAEAARADAVENFDCATLIPDYDDLPNGADIWTQMKSAPQNAWDGSVSYYEELAVRDWKAQLSQSRSDFFAWSRDLISFEGIRSLWNDNEEEGVAQ